MIKLIVTLKQTGHLLLTTPIKFTIFENATVYVMASVHEIQMTTIHIQLPKLLSNHLRIR